MRRNEGCILSEVASRWFQVGNFIEARPFAQTISMPGGESCVVVICSDGIWDALLPNAVDALARAMLANLPSTFAQHLCTAALTQRHAYSSDGDEVPMDDTTVVVMRLEDPDDPIKDIDGCGGCA